MAPCNQPQIEECKMMMADIRNENQEALHSVHDALALIGNNITELKKCLLDGNGKPGIVYQQDNRIQKLEDWREAQIERRLERRADDRASIKVPNGETKRSWPEALKTVPWWGWLMLVGSLGPYGWDAIKAFGLALIQLKFGG